MTEQEWLTCTDPRPMLDFLKDNASDRKLRLFACACCRRIWHLLSDKRSRKAVKFSEQYADGLVTEAELRRAGHAAWQAACKSTTGEAVQGERSLQHRAWDAVGVACYENVRLRNCLRFVINAVVEAVNDETRFHPCLLLRDIFGGVFRTVAMGESWLAWNDGAVRKMAQAIYDDRAFDRMPQLADALEEAGCDNPDLLAHCRQPGPHVRGCWAVDLLLGKE